MSDTRFESDARFEQDLRAVLRDLAPSDAPKALRDAVAAVPRSRPMPADRPVAMPRLQMAVFAPLAAVIVLAVVGLVVLLGGGLGGHVAAPSPTASPYTGWTTLTYEAVQPDSTTPPFADLMPTSLAVAEARLRSLGIPFTSEATSSEFGVTVPTDRAAAATSILGIRGDVAFVPLGSEAVAPGDAIDLKAHPPLFRWEGIASASLGTDAVGQGAVDITLEPPEQASFATYTSAHIGEYLAIVMDAKVVTAPVMQAAILNGQVQITSGTVGGLSPDVQTNLVALLSSGPYPAPVRQVGSTPGTPPANPWTPAPSPVLESSPPTVASAPPGGSIPRSGNAVTDACLSGAGVSLPDGYVPGAPAVQQDAAGNGAAMLLLPVRGAPDLVWVEACLYERLPDGSAWLTNAASGTVPSDFSGPVGIGEQTSSESGAQLVVGRAAGGVKRIAATLSSGATIEAQRGDAAWMVWNRGPASITRVDAFDASGAKVWSDRPMLEGPAFSFDVENRSTSSVVVSVASDYAAVMPGLDPGQRGTISIPMSNPANGIAVEVQGRGCRLLAKADYPTSRPFTLVIEDGATPGTIRLSTLDAAAASPIPLPSNALVGCGG